MTWCYIIYDINNDHIIIIISISPTGSHSCGESMKRKLVTILASLLCQSVSQLEDNLAGKSSLTHITCIALWSGMPSYGVVVVVVVRAQ